ncbi:MAG: single-stranded-DNA-specific exonuclease RecJ [Planctomycetes bacterium]|nr:single-stranded-DNA-specific exonuclease RecJ [Planctomycetota bacterium]
MSGLRWVLAPEPNGVAGDISRELGISKITASLLAQRLPEPSVEAAKTFLRPSLADLHSPWKLKEIDKAAERLARAVREKEPIVIHGDYDTDGVTASAVLIKIFEALGNPAEHFLPCRMEDGYGISDAFVKRMIERGRGVVVTVDCGVCEHEHVASLQQAGIDVIVTDHHEQGEPDLPLAYAVIDPKRKDSEYPFRELVGAGVAFKLAWAVCEKYMGTPKVGDRLQTALISLLPYVAIGTIADVAPLIDENRILVSFGIKAMRTPLPGLKALMDVARQDADNLTARDISFMLAPRLNAAGRMGEADLALRLLIEEDPEKAAKLATELDRKNVERQALCREMVDLARKKVEAEHDLERDAAIVVADESWHEGVIGIVAGRLSDEFNKPALVIALSGDGTGKGSGRSIDGLNLYDAMNRSRERFISFGGHEQAAGFRIAADQIDGLRRELCENCRNQIREKSIEPQMYIDGMLDLSSVTGSLVNEVEMLAPFGEGNPTPRFLAKEVQVAGTPKLLGSSGKHFSYNASQNGVAYRAVVFNNTDWLKQMDAGQLRWDVVFNLDLNKYFSNPRIELKIKDMHPSEA